MVRDLPSDRHAPQETLHASCVAIAGHGVLILGASGSGKSALALQLMAFGAELVCDDGTLLLPGEDGLYAQCPAQISGMIEARGIGLLKAQSCPRVRVALVVDLDETEICRLPELRRVEIRGYMLTCVRKIEGAHFAASVFQLAKGGRVSPS